MGYYVCKHAREIDLNRLQEKRQIKPLTCSDCDVTGSDLWICLFCDHVGCGRYSQHQHSLEHYETTRDAQKESEDDNGHMLVSHLEERTVWCYVCDQAWDWDMTMIEALKIELPLINGIKKKTSQDVFISDMEENGHDNHSSSAEIFEYPKISMNHDASHTLSNATSLESTLNRYEESCGMIGLENLGNTCYINATLQALIHW
jgi:uncharacterized UBP type Zn finger protein